MGYAGKPSKACERCRIRRIKCDLIRPCCRNCTRASILCPGYLNQQDLLFQNQTKDVVDRYSKNAKQSFDNTRSSKPHEPEYFEIVRNPDLCLYGESGHSATLDVAVPFLLRCYLRGSSFEWVPKLYGTSSSSPILDSVVHATALAAFSHATHKVSLLVQARATYSDALIEVREAIEQDNSVDNPTWASVLLLSRFETLLQDGNEHSITDTWLNHISGAFAILQARQKQKDLGGAVSRALMEQTIHNYNITWFRTKARPPKALTIAVQELYLDLQRQDDSALREMRLAFHEVSTAYHRFRRVQYQPDKPTTLEMMRWAEEIDKQAILFQCQLSRVSAFQELSVTNARLKGEKFDVQPCFEIYHVYRDHHEARLWNGLRMIRLTIHKSIGYYAKELCPPGGVMSTYKDNQTRHALECLIEKSQGIVAGMVADVCASAPQFLRTASPHCTHAAACFLAWPLFVAGRLSSDGYQAFIKDSLRWIAAELNIKIAAIAADALSDNEYKDGSLHACHMF